MFPRRVVRQVHRLPNRWQFEGLQSVERDAWRQEIIGHQELFLTLRDHLPKEMICECELLICRI